LNTTAPQEPKVEDVGPWSIGVKVVPNRVFGLTDSPLQAIQVLSGVIGLPALLALVAGVYLQKGAGKA